MYSKIKYEEIKAYIRLGTSFNLKLDCLQCIAKTKKGIDFAVPVPWWGLYVVRVSPVFKSTSVCVCARTCVRSYPGPAKTPPPLSRHPPVCRCTCLFHLCLDWACFHPIPRVLTQPGGGGSASLRNGEKSEKGVHFYSWTINVGAGILAPGELVRDYRSLQPHYL